MQEPTLYHNGKRLMTDGGVAAQSNDPAQIAGMEALLGGFGFDQFVANSDAARAASKFGRDSEITAQASQRAGQLRANATLRQDEWKSLDNTLVEVAKHNLTIVNDLRSRGLTINTDLGTLIHEYQTESDWSGAELDMGAETRDSDDETTFSTHGVPLPVAHKSFHVPYRQLLASRRRGQSLQTTNLSKATRAVAEVLENQTAYGSGVNVDGNTVTGLHNHPDANAVTLSSGNPWTDDTNTTSDNIRTDVLSGIETLENEAYGPEGSGYLFYLGRSAYQEVRARDTGTDQERGLLTRLNEEFGDIVDFRRADFLNAGDGIMFKPTSDVVELAVASDMQTVEWSSNDGMSVHAKVMASITPVVKSDDNGACGIATYSGLA